MEHAPAPLPPPVFVLGLGLPVRPGPATDPPAAASLAAVERHPLLQTADVIIAGKAQLAALDAHPAEKIAISADTQSLYDSIKKNREAGKRQVVLCSGDPLLFGLGARLIEVLGAEAVRVVPGVSSLQGAAACLGIAWEGIRVISLHGRSDWLPLAHALLSRSPVFLLTDARSAPAAVAAWMLERGCTAYVLHVLENICLSPQGEVKASLTARLTLEEASRYQPQPDAAAQRVLLLEPSGASDSWSFGLDDQSLSKENNLLTKLPVRAAGLACLGIAPDHTVWDLGAGSGAVSLEAARLAWRGQVFAVEQKPERLEHIRSNRRLLGAANLEIIAGALPGCLPRYAEGQLRPDASEEALQLPRPHRVFVGGGLGSNREQAEILLTKAWNALLPGGRLLAHCVLLGSLELARSILLSLGADLSVICLHASTSSPLAADMRLEALNPVFLVLGKKSQTEPFV